MNAGYANTLKMIGMFKSDLALRIGKLVYDDDNKKFFFSDAEGKYFEKENIWFLDKERNYNNGYKDLPLPHTLKNKEFTETGDILLYTYLDDTFQNIVIIGSLYNLSLDGYDAVLNTADDIKNWREKYLSRNNKSRFFSVQDDGKGNVTIYLKGKKADQAEDDGTGNLAIKITGTDQNGNLSLELNGKVAITQTQTDGDTETAISQILLDNTKDAEKIKIIDKTKNIFLMNKDGIVLETTAIRIGKTQTLKKILDKLIDAITKITQNTPAGPTVSPPLNMAAFASIKQELTDFMDKQ